MCAPHLLQLEDLDYRLSWALRDLRAHQLVLRAQGELNMHLSGLPQDMQQQVFDQVDQGAALLGDGGSATVRWHIATVSDAETQAAPARRPAQPSPARAAAA